MLKSHNPAPPTNLRGHAAPLAGTKAQPGKPEGFALLAQVSHGAQAFGDVRVDTYAFFDHALVGFCEVRVE